MNDIHRFCLIVFIFSVQGIPTYIMKKGTLQEALLLMYYNINMF